MASFLQPLFLFQGENFFFVHLKKQWHNILVATKASARTTVRFTLTRFTPQNVATESSSYTCQGTFQFIQEVTVPRGYIISEKVETDEYKGVKLKQVENLHTNEEEWEEL
jgi:hypothetical protein